MDASKMMNKNMYASKTMNKKMDDGKTMNKKMDDGLTMNKNNEEGETMGNNEVEELMDRNEFQCKVCFELFAKNWNLKRHISRRHVNNRATVSCSRCRQVIINYRI